ncbi:Uncharacterised protein [uncultured Roseburia sp.]|uniref:Uncharacterized protein n=1 Tax=Brotonthovivens ammoniilytica TaxID=2981725 RepID=A0ABT2TG63_9FIRM|nr:hypothetical protein [Brotonthovivens ammoniilytica]MCU6761184.1 hypothetical protein [Brotonthovivens ammoniilytica]SCI21311.1 Uncharacterised protein [uncultured Roseburia sp.]
MFIDEMANRLIDAKKSADFQLERLKILSISDRYAIADSIRKFVAYKMLLEDHEVTDNITEMVRINVAKAMHISVSELKDMDKPGMCGSAPAVLSKRILLFIDIQNKLGVKLPAEQTPEIQTVQELTDMLIPLL